MRDQKFFNDSINFISFCNNYTKISLSIKKMIKQSLIFAGMYFFNDNSDNNDNNYDDDNDNNKNDMHIHRGYVLAADGSSVINKGHINIKMQLKVILSAIH